MFLGNSVLLNVILCDTNFTSWQVIQTQKEDRTKWKCLETSLLWSTTAFRYNFSAILKPVTCNCYLWPVAICPANTHWQFYSQMTNHKQIKDQSLLYHSVSYKQPEKRQHPKLSPLFFTPSKAVSGDNNMSKATNLQPGQLAHSCNISFF